jgi:hypothetical protein
MEGYYITLVFDMHLPDKYLTYETESKLMEEIRRVLKDKYPFASFNSQRCDCGNRCHDVRLAPNQVQPLVDSLYSTRIYVLDQHKQIGYIDIYQKLVF